MQKWTHSEAKLLQTFLELQHVATGTLGERNWFLLQTYGQIVRGRRAGLCVGVIPPDEALPIVRALGRGESVPVHLTHRHRTGVGPTSQLRLIRGRLLMSFPDRDEFA